MWIWAFLFTFRFLLLQNVTIGGFISRDNTAMFVHKTIANGFRNNSLIPKRDFSLSFVLCYKMTAMTSIETHLYRQTPTKRPPNRKEPTDR